MLAGASLPAWFAFLPWLWITHRNARALLVGGLGSRRWLLVQAAVPGVSLLAGGIAIGRLWRSIEPPADRTGWLNDRATRLQVVWMSAGVVWVVTAIMSATLAQAGSIVAAVRMSAGQSIATLCRGAAGPDGEAHRHSS